MIQQGLCLEDGKGFLTIRVSYMAHWSRAGEDLRSPSLLTLRVSACSEANPSVCTKCC